MTRICKIKDCDKPACNGKGFCTMHYTRLLRHGTPTPSHIKFNRGDPLQFIKSAIDTNRDDCIIWPYGKNVKGYGRISYKGKATLAHRLVLTLMEGNPDGTNIYACHSQYCSSRACINPKHLRWGTPKLNTQDMMKFGKPKLGEKCSWSKLSESDVLEIRKSDKTSKELSLIYDISINYAASLKRKEKWKHLPD